MLADHPALKIALVAVDDPIELPHPRIDVAIQQQPPPAQARLVVHEIARDQRVLCASPAYLEQHGRPTTPADLAHHHWIAYGNSPAPDAGRTPQTNWTVRVNSGDTALAAALAGAGIGPNHQSDDATASHRTPTAPAAQSNRRPADRLSMMRAPSRHQIGGSIRRDRMSEELPRDRSIVLSCRAGK
ncbi:LysR substrate-binding domain-containing protein [Cupriavidus basilensis]|uniref:LysR substrate-binding domain-containing protein n=1 Tax=Cupriavidus basilensis TaxID=68895 RepID=UPI003D35089E